MAKRTDIAEAKKAARREENKKKLKRERTLKQLKWTVLIVAAVAVCVGVIIGINAIVHSTKTANGSYMREATVAENDYGKVNAAMLAYYIGEKYMDAVDGTDPEVLAAMGIDTSKKLNEMKYDGSETWFDVLADEATNDAADWLSYCSAAKKAGFALTDAEKEAVKARAGRVDLSRLANGITRADVEDAILIQALGEKYKEHITTGNTADADAISAEIEANRAKYYTVDYRYFFISYFTEESMPDMSGEESSGVSEEPSSEDSGEISEETSEETSEEVVNLEREIAVEEANRMASATTESDFEKFVAEFLVKYFEKIDENTAAERAASYKDTDTAISDPNLSKWIFDASRKVLDTTVLDYGEGTVAAFMLTALPKLSEGYKTVNVSCIRVDDEETAKAVEALVKGKDAEAFALAAITYSRDMRSCFYGGDIDGYVDSIKNTELNEWLFGDTVSEGDIMIAKGNAGWYVVRYRGEGYGSVRTSVKKQLSDSKITSALASALSSAKTSKNTSSASTIDY
ncbi:MAG: hypothetical protein MRZ26_07020 [Ruminococcus sp.]|nr:hypothetical protein [Ruminococcus sp.]